MIYLGSFLHTTNQEKKDEKDRRHGEFILIIEAENHDRAIEKFKERIIAYEESSDFFEGQCSVFFTHLFEFENVPWEQALMLNYKSFAGDPIMPFIGCSVPTDVTDACRIYEWEDSRPEVDGLKGRPFLQFG